MKLIVNADDFGYSIGHNHGIIHAHTHGIVKSTSLMANGEEVLHAINLLRQHTSLDVGIHVVLDYKRPISNPTLIPTLLDQNQNFKKFLIDDIYSINLEEVRFEIESQILFLQSFKLNLSHLDSHHHIHLHPHLFPTFLSIAKKYNLILRLVKSIDLDHQLLCESEGLKYVFCNTSFYNDTVSLEFFTNYNNDNHIEELMTHPAFCDETIMRESSYNLKRVEELKVLSNPIIKTMLKSKNIALISHKDLRD